MNRFTVTGATILTPSERIASGSVQVAAGRFTHVGVSPAGENGRVVDAQGFTMVPGLIELQINGAFGQDFTTDPASIWEVASGLPRYGVTRFLPTIVTSPLGQIASAQAVLQGGPPPGFCGAVPLGLHVEGPFLNPERKGAHREEHLRLPDLTACKHFTPEQGVRLVTLAPELPGALEAVRLLAGQGIVVSAGHSQANLEQARLAFAAGVRYGTHLFNAMPPLHQFEPGLVGAILDTPGMRFGLIADGIHVHPTLVNLIWKLTGPGRVTLVSDGMAALGQGPGRYRLGDHQEVLVDERSARLPDGVLAGSILTQIDAIRNLIAFTGCSLEEALSCMTSTPADLLGLEMEIGRIAPGLRADFVLLSPELEVVQTYVDGELVYQKG